MTKRMLVNAAQEGQVRVTIVQDGVLEDLDVAHSNSRAIKGNIYKARVVSVEPGLQAAFVDYGADRNGFITFNDIHERFYARKPKGGNGRPRIQDVIFRGNELLIQAQKEEMGNKGAAMNCDLSIPGRYIVLMPYSRSSGISRKIEDERTRNRLRELIKKLEIPEDMGLIVRTAGVGRTKSELQKDFQQLIRIWAHIQHAYEQLSGPGLVYREEGMVIRTIRDYFTDDIDEVVVDDEAMHQNVLDFFERHMAGLSDKVRLYRGKMPIFSNYGLERQLENIASQRVPLASGGSIVVSPTEALIAIDVNSGRSKGQADQEAMALQTNTEAAVEVARQLRLRDLGGLIVVDFIDMSELQNRRAIERELKTAMKIDKARVEIGRVSRFGLLELSRQRVRGAIHLSTHRLCPMCDGTGSVTTTETAGVTMIRRLQELAVSAPSGARLRGRLPVAVALYLLNEQRTQLGGLESEFDVEIEVIPDAAAVSTREAFEVVHPEGKEVDAARKDRRERRPKERARPIREAAGERGPVASKPMPVTPAAAQDMAEADEEPMTPARVVGRIPPEKLAPSAATAPDGRVETESNGVEERAPEESKQRRRSKRPASSDGKVATETALPTAVAAPEGPIVTEPSDAPGNEQEQASAEGEPVDETDTTKRRRRRRRRKPKGAADGAEVANGDDGVEQVDPGAQEVAAKETPASEPKAVAAPDAEEEAKLRRNAARARNRARRRKGADGSESGGTTPELDATPEAAVPVPRRKAAEAGDSIPDGSGRAEAPVVETPLAPRPRESKALLEKVKRKLRARVTSKALESEQEEAAAGRARADREAAQDPPIPKGPTTAGGARAAAGGSPDLHPGELSANGGLAREEAVDSAVTEAQEIAARPTRASKGAKSDRATPKRTRRPHRDDVDAGEQPAAGEEAAASSGRRGSRGRRRTSAADSAEVGEAASTHGDRAPSRDVSETGALPPTGSTEGTGRAAVSKKPARTSRGRGQDRAGGGGEEEAEPAAVKRSRRTRMSGPKAQAGQTPANHDAQEATGAPERGRGRPSPTTGSHKAGSSKPAGRRAPSSRRKDGEPAVAGPEPAASEVAAAASIFATLKDT